MSTTTQVAEVLRKWYKSIQESGEATAIQADVRDREHVEHMVTEVQAQFGPVDILVSNAAMSFVQKPIKELTWEEVSQKLNDDMKAAFNVTKAVTPLMVNNSDGRIVYVSTGLAKHLQIGFAAHGSTLAIFATGCTQYGMIVKEKKREACLLNF